ncbi:hypothetical protein [uncultured Helicobacter sp.]|uniref:hypothetical protein n=1 Tax=uncultured Helicobacter sp. TaxID=175537 RepID=UPI00261851CE|nr:hypothetical protein [uncultured Helicobacter sp.]
MKKIALGFLVPGLTSLSAIESAQKSEQNINLTQEDMKALFISHNVNAIVLTQEEMHNTQGQGFLASLGVGFLVDGLQWGYNCIFREIVTIGM